MNACACGAERVRVRGGEGAAVAAGPAGACGVAAARERGRARAAVGPRAWVSRATCKVGKKEIGRSCDVDKEFEARFFFWRVLAQADLNECGGGV